MIGNTVSIFLSAVSISLDFAAVRLIFLDKIRLVRYEKFVTMRNFLKKFRTPVNFIPDYAVFSKKPHSSEFYTAL